MRRTLSRFVENAPRALQRPLAAMSLRTLALQGGPSSLEGPATGATGGAVLCVGDVALVSQRASRDPEGMLASLARELPAAELRIANVEAVLSDAGTKLWERGAVLAAPPASVAALTGASIDVAVCANNHVLDLGPEAAHQSRAHLVANGIDVVGTGDDAATARRGVVRTLSSGLRVGILAYTDHYVVTPETAHAAPARAIDEDILADIARIRATVDVVLLHLHWGYEWVLHPLLSHRRRARTFASAGADAVICHHAHVPQGVEVWQGSVIAYGLGNCYFPYKTEVLHPWRNVGLALHLDLAADGVRRVGLHPTSICADDVVRPSTGRAQRELLGGLAVLNERLRDDDALAHVEAYRDAFELGRFAQNVTWAFGRADWARLREYGYYLENPRHRDQLARIAVLDGGRWATLATLLDSLRETAWQTPDRIPELTRLADIRALGRQLMQSRPSPRGLPGRLPW